MSYATLLSCSNLPQSSANANFNSASSTPAVYFHVYTLPQKVVRCTTHTSRSQVGRLSRGPWSRAPWHTILQSTCRQGAVSANSLPCCALAACIPVCASPPECASTASRGLQVACVGISQRRRQPCHLTLGAAILLHLQCLTERLHHASRRAEMFSWSLRTDRRNFLQCFVSSNEHATLRSLTFLRHVNRVYSVTLFSQINGIAPLSCS